MISTRIRRILKFIRSSASVLRSTPVKNSTKMDTKTVKEIPIIVVLGETGVGKTKLAIELCRRFSGEVISADSMQIYEGLDIITNKVTPEEACGITYHLISILSPASSRFNVQTFQRLAVKTIADIWNDRRAMPVVVGGTNYYIESLLWNRSVNSANNCDFEDDADESGDSFTQCIPFDVTSMTDEQLHEELRRIDPVMSNRKHPKNRRKIIRSLQIFYQTGRPHSEWLNEQHSSNGGSILGGPLRFQRLCVFWLTCDDRSVLKERLRNRIDEMVGKGLREEITEFYDRHYEECFQKYGPDATTKGILQSIGLKEFEAYLQLPLDQRSSEIGEKAFMEGVEKLIQVTSRYAAKQKRWIMNRFSRLAARDSIPIYILDTTDVKAWNDDVSKPACEIVEAFLAGHQPDSNVRTATPPEKYVSEWSTENQYCDLCDRVVSGLQWEDHIKSYKHRLQKCKKTNDYPLIQKKDNSSNGDLNRSHDDSGHNEHAARNVS